MKVTLFKRGKVWWADFHVDGQRVRKSLKTTNRKIADDLRLQLEYRLRQGDVPRQQEKIGLESFLTEYEAYSLANKRPKTHATDMRRIQEFLENTDARHVGEVTTKQVSDFLSMKVLKDSIKPATVLRYREILHALFNHAIRLDYIRDNPVAKVPRPRIPDKDPRFLSKDQVVELLEVVKGDMIAPLLATAVYAGLRREELTWLTWSDLDLRHEPPLMRIRAKTVGGESWLPKTKRNRTVPISSKLLKILEAHPKAKAPWVFPSPQGCRWDPDNLSQRFSSLMRKAGLPWNFLDLRHTFGSQLARKDVSILKIAKLMGNSPEVARKHYVHLMPEEMGDDVEF